VVGEAAGDGVADVEANLNELLKKYKLPLIGEANVLEGTSSCSQWRFITRAEKYLTNYKTLFSCS